MWIGSVLLYKEPKIIDRQCAYPEEDSKKCSSKLQGEPGRDIDVDIIVVIVNDSDEVSVVVKDHSQGAEEQDAEERRLLTRV